MAASKRFHLVNEYEQSPMQQTERQARYGIIDRIRKK